MMQVLEKPARKKPVIKGFSILSLGVFRVHGCTGDYTTDLNAGTCDCPAFSFGRGAACKHLIYMAKVVAAGVRYGFSALDMKLRDKREEVSQLASFAIRYRVAYLAEKLGTTRQAVRNAYVYW